MTYKPLIVAEDNHLIVVNKPFGMPSQGDISGDLCLFDWTKNYIKEKYNKSGAIYLGLLHRLDRPTGGILVMAKTSKAASRMSKLFQERKIQKTYYALTEKIPSEHEAKLSHYVKKLKDKNIMRAYDKNVHGSKSAVLNYELVKTIGGRALLKVNPLTGRRHQIRVQLSSIGCTIKGDVKYGKSQFNADKSICLLAQKIEFVHPVRKELVSYEIELPNNEIWLGA